jgi:hypothetical protein
MKSVNKCLHLVTSENFRQVHDAHASLAFAIHCLTAVWDEVAYSTTRLGHQYLAISSLQKQDSYENCDL